MLILFRWWPRLAFLALGFLTAALCGWFLVNWLEIAGMAGAGHCTRRPREGLPNSSGLMRLAWRTQDATGAERYAVSVGPGRSNVRDSAR